MDQKRGSCIVETIDGTEKIRTADDTRFSRLSTERRAARNRKPTEAMTPTRSGSRRFAQYYFTPETKNTVTTTTNGNGNERKRQKTVTAKTCYVPLFAGRVLRAESFFKFVLDVWSASEQYRYRRERAYDRCRRTRVLLNGPFSNFTASPDPCGSTDATRKLYNGRQNVSRKT